MYLSNFEPVPYIISFAQFIIAFQSSTTLMLQFVSVLQNLSTKRELERIENRFTVRILVRCTVRLESYVLTRTRTNRVPVHVSSSFSSHGQDWPY